MTPTIVCKWCGKHLGVLPSGILICPRCDHTDVGGPPNSNKAKDQNPRP